MISEADRRTLTSEAVFRVFLSLIFLVAGTTHLLAPAKVAARLVAAPFGHLATSWASPELLVVLAGTALVIGGLGLSTGAFTRWSALLLIAVLIPITITVQISVESLGPLFKNVAILGGLIYFATNGARGYSIDSLLSTLRRRLPAVDPAVDPVVLE